MTWRGPDDTARYAPLSRYMRYSTHESSYNTGRVISLSGKRRDEKALTVSSRITQSDLFGIDPCPSRPSVVSLTKRARYSRAASHPRPALLGAEASGRTTHRPCNGMVPIVPRRLKTEFYFLLSSLRFRPKFCVIESNVAEHDIGRRRRTYHERIFRAAAREGAPGAAARGGVGLTVPRLFFGRPSHEWDASRRASPVNDRPARRAFHMIIFSYKKK
ncbi:hypothetical protein EVAR_37309_1 [Eumeta japonica]|uniref:Uncharacterized protein n=1 Tax=Eumeta variegata TaxID=151549 RepID=A0A4C1X1P8_EUMVA|nr:hypothetical protein EVAR_37309_1 [Eumeta japonica]